MSNFKSVKGAADGTVWAPTAKTITGKDGKTYNVRADNPEKGKEPTMVAYYVGSEFVESKKEGQSGNDLHKFQTESGEIVKIWGSVDLTKQLKAAVLKYGIGRLTQVTWNGYLVAHGSKNKPEDVLKQMNTKDYYHDWEVAVDDVTPAIKVEGAEVYKSNTTNEAPAVATTAAPSAPDPVAAMPATLEEAGGEEEEDLPF